MASFLFYFFDFFIFCVKTKMYYVIENILEYVELILILHTSAFTQKEEMFRIVWDQIERPFQLNIVWRAEWQFTRNFFFFSFLPSFNEELKQDHRQIQFHGSNTVNGELRWHDDDIFFLLWLSHPQNTCEICIYCIQSINWILN